MARIRGWRWLAIAGVAASLGWGVLTGLVVNVNTTAAELLLTAGLALTFLGTLITERGPYCDRQPNVLALAALAGLAALSLYFGLVNPVYPPLVSGILLAGALGAAASRWPSIAPAALIAGGLAVSTIMLLTRSGRRRSLRRCSSAYFNGGCWGMRRSAALPSRPPPWR